MGGQFNFYKSTAMILTKMFRYLQLIADEPKLQISNKCFIYCPAEDKAEATIFGIKPQDNRKLEISYKRDN